MTEWLHMIQNLGETIYMLYLAQACNFSGDQLLFSSLLVAQKTKKEKYFQQMHSLLAYCVGGCWWLCWCNTYP